MFAHIFVVKTQMTTFKMTIPSNCHHHDESNSNPKFCFLKSWFLEDFQFSFTESNQLVKPALFVAERTSPSAVVSCSVLRTDRRATILH